MADLLDRPPVQPQPAPREIPPLHQGDHLDRATFHERYEGMPPGTRAELIDGVVYMHSPATLNHSEPNAELVGWLFTYKVHTPGVGLSDNGTLLLPGPREPQPDAVLRIFPECGGRSREDRNKWLTGSPELVAEVAYSTEAYDLHSKRLMYERAGVQEYLAAVTREERVFWWSRQGGTFQPLELADDGLYRSLVFPGLWLDPTALFRCDSAALVAALQRGLATDEHVRFAAELAARRQQVR
jgi:Uma2 family endonuclease